MKTTSYEILAIRASIKLNDKSHFVNNFTFYSIKNKVIKDELTLENLELFYDVLKKELKKTNLTEKRKDAYEEIDAQLKVLIPDLKKIQKEEDNEEYEKMKNQMDKLGNEKMQKKQLQIKELKKLIGKTKAKKQSQPSTKIDDSDEETIGVPITNDLTSLEMLIEYDNILGKIKNIHDGAIDDCHLFDDMITNFEKENDINNKKDIAEKIGEQDFVIEEKIEKMDGLLTEVNDNIDNVVKRLITDVDEMISNNAFSENAPKSMSVPNEIIDFVDEFPKIIKIPVATGGQKKQHKEHLNFIKNVLQNFRRDYYEPVNLAFEKLKLVFEKRRNDMVQYVKEDDNDNKKPKFEPETKLTENDLKNIKETLPKEDLIKVIMRRHPSLKKEDLNSMSVEDLIQISHQLGVNLLDLNILKVPKNATKEEKELIENLENIRRQREVEAEFKKLKSQIDNDEVKSEKERTDQNLKTAAKSLIKKPTYKPDRVNTKKMENKKPKDEKKIERAVAKILKDDTPVIKLNDEQIQGMGKMKKSNPYMEFLKDFRKKNAGMYDNKEMLKQEGNAWNMLKGGCGCQIDIEGGSSMKKSKDNRRMNYQDEKKLDWKIASNIEPEEQDGIYDFPNEFKDEKQGFIPTMEVENNLANRMKQNIRNPNEGERKLALLMHQRIKKQLGN
eukprot:gene3340-5888_t